MHSYVYIFPKFLNNISLEVITKAVGDFTLTRDKAFQ